MINANIGVNFQGFRSSAYQNRITPEPPQDYIEDSFEIFSKNNISMLRIPYSWESWEADKSGFYEDLEKISKVADAYSISCIYDNHQWECSSWLGWGIGMPNSLLSSDYTKSTGRPPTREVLKDFWKRWWNRKITNNDNIDGWEAQISFVKEVMNYLNNKKSTFGFEVLNEPQVYNALDYDKVGRYHTYAIMNLRTISDKPLFFNAAISNTSIDNPILQSQAAPKNGDNVIYDIHMYPPSYYNMQFFRFISSIARNLQMYVGEFNSDYKYGANLSKDQLMKYLNLFHRFKIFGCTLWRWYYIRDLNIPAFNLTQVENGRINPNANFINLSDTLKEYNHKHKQQAL
jgi:cellulase (glycosyl hydrolase family 5)